MSTRAFVVSIAGVVAVLLVTVALLKISAEQRYGNCVAKVQAIYSVPGNADDQVKSELRGEREAMKRELAKCSRTPFDN